MRRLKLLMISTAFFLCFFVPSSYADLRTYYEDYFSGTKVFLESLYGVRLADREKVIKDEFMASEFRLHGETIYYPSIPLLEDISSEIKYSGDLYFDMYDDKLHYETRELSFFMRPSDYLDVKLGRQILTWGTGDYLFINDMFPKDYLSFFIGRDDEYLKKPVDAFKTTLFFGNANIDFVYMPYFTPNTIVKGDRLSFYDSYRGKITGFESERFLREPPFQFNNGEVAMRFNIPVKRYEVSAYFFHGWYKNPRGYKDNVSEMYYPPVNVYGNSIRGPVGGGIFNFEWGYCDSVDDREGTNRMIENPMIKYLVGYTKDFKNDIDLGLQFYAEQMLAYSEYKKSLMPGDYKRSHFRQLITFLYRQDFLQQTLHFNIFLYYSPNDEDTYLRPSLTYDFTDNFKMTLGGNLFWGVEDFTEFGQLEENTNIYLRARYSF